MKVCQIKVRVEPENAYWEGQVQRLQAIEKTLRTGKAYEYRTPNWLLLVWQTWPKL
jgi:hypothetical protein